MNIIRFIRGDTETFNITINDLTGVPYILSPGDNLLFTVKKTTRDKSNIIQKRITSSMSITFTHDDTKDLEPGRYVYDVQLTQENGTVKTIIEPTPFILKEDVTHE